MGWLGILWRLAAAIPAIWVVLVARYAPIVGEERRLPLAAGIAVLFALALWRPRYFAIPLLLSALVIFWRWYSLEPKFDRHWRKELARLPTVEWQGDEVILNGVRDFHYRTENDADPHYVTKRFRVADLSSWDMFVSYWSGKVIAHLFVSFGFKSGERFAVSVEVRRAEGESFSEIAGFFRDQEIIYVVAEERDLVGLRTSIRTPPEQVYLLRPQVKRTAAQKLLMSYLTEIDSLSRKPQFYNTLLDNCTTRILVHSRAGNPLAKYSWRLFFPGYTPEYLYHRGSLGRDRTLDEIMQIAKVNSKGSIGMDAATFSKAIREGNPEPPMLEQ